MWRWVASAPISPRQVLCWRSLLPFGNTAARIPLTVATQSGPCSSHPEHRESRPRTEARVESLMGRKPELRFAFIEENARFVADLDV